MPEMDTRSVWSEFIVSCVLSLLMPRMLVLALVGCILFVAALFWSYLLRLYAQRLSAHFFDDLSSSRVSLAPGLLWSNMTFASFTQLFDCAAPASSAPFGHMLGTLATPASSVQLLGLLLLRDTNAQNSADELILPNLDTLMTQCLLSLLLLFRVLCLPGLLLLASASVLVHAHSCTCASSCSLYLLGYEYMCLFSGLLLCRAPRHDLRCFTNSFSTYGMVRPCSDKILI